MFFGQAGKEAMAHGVSTFNKSASREYKNLEREKKENLADLCVQSEETRSMTVKDVKKAGAKAFQKIQIQVGFFPFLPVLLLLYT